MKPALLIFILTIGLVGFLGCEDTVKPINNNNNTIDYADCDRNALRMDLYLSHSVRPSFYYYYDILNHLEIIDECFVSDSMGQIYFRANGYSDV